MSNALDLSAVLREEAEEILKSRAMRDGIASQRLPAGDPYKLLHDQDFAALCLSGGGIRSASFALGVIQALADIPSGRVVTGSVQAGGVSHPQSSRPLLQDFDYLSTVSGGGYIGAWLTAWLKRDKFSTVRDGLRLHRQNPDIEPDAIAGLRRNSNFLTPKIGALSADSWTAVALYLRNLLLNWMVVGAAFCTVLLALKILAVGLASLWRGDESWYLPVGEYYAVIGAIGLLIITLWFSLLNRPTRAIINTGQASFLRFGLLSAVGSGGFWMLYFTTYGNYAGLARIAGAARDEVGSLATWLSWLSWFTFDFVNRIPPRATLLLLGAIVGALIYAAAWLATLLTGRLAGRQPGPAKHAWIDFGFFFTSGMVYGAMLGFGAWLLGAYSYELVTHHPRMELYLAMAFVLPWALLSLLTAEAVFVGLSSYQENSDDDREWFGRAAGWYTVAGVAWIVVVALAFFGSKIAALLTPTFQSVIAAVGGAAGIATLLLANDSASPADDGKGRYSIRNALSRYGLSIATPIFIVVLVMFLSNGLDRLVLTGSFLDSALLATREISIKPPPPGQLQSEWAINWWTDWSRLVVGTAIFGLIALIASGTVNINRFSLHALYRNRLIRAFLGATNPSRQPNPFTGFDPNDNIKMEELKPTSRAPGHWQLLHIVNMAMNIVSTERLAWQERKAQSFTVSALHSGSGCKAYRRSASYGAKNGGITLGTAMAISGAAASPNMGYHSAPSITFIMALFNVRLGWWLGNPGPEGDKTYWRHGPRWAMAPYVEEAFGLTTDSKPYVYLSDGGHFENIGLYEMVRRRCRHIVVSDAGCDPEFAFEDLGNAVRKIALDLGIQIRFKGLEELSPRSPDGKPHPAGAPYHALGEIFYPEAKPGERSFILYVKASYHGRESAGVRSYATAHPGFPHDTTADQWFSESQFESYRALGYEVMSEVLGEAYQRYIPAAPDETGFRSPDLKALIRALA